MPSRGEITGVFDTLLIGATEVGCRPPGGNVRNHSPPLEGNDSSAIAGFLLLVFALFFATIRSIGDRMSIFCPILSSFF